MKTSTTSQTPEELMQAFETAVRGLSYANHDPDCATEIGDEVCDCDPTWLFGNDDIAAITKAAQSYGDQRAQQAHKLTQEADKDIAKNAHYRGKTAGAVIALNQLERDVMAVASKYDDETNAIWLGNINRIRAATRSAALPTGTQNCPKCGWAIALNTRDLQRENCINPDCDYDIIRPTGNAGKTEEAV